MRRRRLLWQLFPSYLVIVLVALLTVMLYAFGALRGFYIDRTAEDIEARAWLVEERFGDALLNDPESVDGMCKHYGRLGHTRITVVSPEGKVVGDSEEDISKMDNHADRPEIAGAIVGKIKPSVRHSHTLGMDMMYVAIPVERDERTIGTLRTSIPLESIDEALRLVRGRMAVGGLVVGLLAAVVSLLVSRRISRPLEQLRNGAERFAEGDFSRKLPVAASQEIASLAETMNRMAAELDQRIRTIVRQRNEREAVLSSMVEGVLAVDAEQRIINVNQAGGSLLEIDVQGAKGRSLQEIVRNPHLQNLAHRVLEERTSIEEDITAHDATQRILSVHGTVLQDSGAKDSPRREDVGVLLVLHDVTALRRVEDVRRDFVANVSHELRTPITSIKGFVETLREGAIGDTENAERFLQIVAEQTDRLNSIIGDLLALSRIEQDGDTGHIDLQPGTMEDVLAAAIATCRHAAEAKGVAVELNCDEELTATINGPLLEQATVNLIDNAVKYSDKGETVFVEAEQLDDEVVIRVRDNGCGIAPRHQARLFERFYRVDKARSRALGGTGLGLAIVKHIAQAHGGRATVDSKPGRGSTFSIHLPAVR